MSSGLAALSRRIGEWYTRAAVWGGRTRSVAALEALLIAFALAAAFSLQSAEGVDWWLYGAALAFLLPVRMAFLYRYNLVRGWWRYTGVNEALDLTRAIVFGSLAFVSVWHLLLFFRLPLAFDIVLLEATFSAALLGGGRMFSHLLAGWADPRTTRGRLVALIGAGRGARLVIPQAQEPHSGFSVLFCLDDDVSKHGLQISGVPVLGAVEELPRLLGQHRVDEVWIAVPSATDQQMDRFVSLCQQAGVACKTLPTLREIVAGNLLEQLREVRLEDLLGREPLGADFDSVRNRLTGKVVMVTGAAGSIGSEIAAQVLEFAPARLVCVDQNENGIFFLERRLAQHAGGKRVVCCVGDVGSDPLMTEIIARHGVETIFHAAAYKHVPVMERNVAEAVRNNVAKLLSLLHTAERAGVRHFVLISSDKAVNPANVMGATKRIGELIVASRPSTMQCVSVRFGNVLGSSGSVVPILKQQLMRGEELTITHPEIRRYFMTISEAVSLVLRASSVGRHGDLLVLDMGEPVRIMDLARKLIRLSGKSESQVKIRITGLRPGEKLREELFYETEQISPTICPKVLRTRSRNHAWAELKEQLAQLQEDLEEGRSDRLRLLMRQIVPEYMYEGAPAVAPARPPAVTAARNGDSPAPERTATPRHAVPTPAPHGD
jgi:FlaA1/EpsC-like NDP-sugar epimerase